MLGIIIIFVIALGSAGAFVALMYMAIAKRRHSARDAVKSLEVEVDSRVELKGEIEKIYAEMVEVGALRKILDEVQLVQESLKAERGRIMITQAELETVEARLRELEEIEREYEASGLETKQELTILQKKQEELAGKNKALRDQIAMNNDQLGKLMGDLQLSAQSIEQLQRMQSELVRTQEKIDTLLVQIEQGNDQYFNFKRRYDALDIEYAQLYEKFSELEAASGKTEEE